MKPFASMKLERLLVGDKQNAVAKRLGLSAQYINDILQGRRGLSIKSALLLEKHYGISATGLLTKQLHEQIALTRKASPL